MAKNSIEPGAADLLAASQYMMLPIAQLRRMQFGRKSEKLDHQMEQLELQLEDLQADEAEARARSRRPTRRREKIGAPAFARSFAVRRESVSEPDRVS